MLSSVSGLPMMLVTRVFANDALIASAISCGMCEANSLVSTPAARISSRRRSSGGFAGGSGLVTGFGSRTFSRTIWLMRSFERSCGSRRSFSSLPSGGLPKPSFSGGLGRRRSGVMPRRFAVLRLIGTTTLRQWKCIGGQCVRHQSSSVGLMVPCRWWQMSLVRESRMAR